MQLEIPGPAGTLEGFLHLPEGDGPFPGVVVCHPHPQMGGDMNNNVVMGVCYSLFIAGIASLRFNFRGAGRSQGVYDEGRGEMDDLLAALEFAASQESIASDGVGLTGYSFGAGVAMKTAQKGGVTKALSLIGRARVDAEDDFSRIPSLPIQFIIGDQDRLMPEEQFKDLTSRLTTPPEMHVIPGADHFFVGQERETAELVTTFFQRRLSVSA